MPNWKQLLYKTDLTDDELKSIPARSNENSLAVWHYYSNKFGITEEHLIKDTPYSFDHYINPKNWENAYFARITDRNILWNIKGVVVHREPYHAGRLFFKTKNTVLRAFMKLVPAEKLFKETVSTSEKFNNESIVEMLHYTKGHLLLKNTPFPYFRNIALGHECHFLHGVIEAICDLHKFRNCTVRHLICSGRIQNIIEKAYGFRNWTCTEDSEYVYINGIKLAQKITLRQKDVNGKMVYWPEIDPSGREPNAVKVLIDFTDKGLKIFSKGEILNAPYCLFEALWNPVKLLYRFFPDKSAVRESSLSIDDLEQQISFSNQKLFEVQETLAESERRLKITEVYTRKSLVDKIRNGCDPTQQAAEEQEKAVMFSDIREFTQFTESMDPQDLVKFLNDYFNCMNEMIHKNNGEIDKLIGDCIMAGFNTPSEAIEAGIDMKKALTFYNRERFEKGEPVVRTGIGITWGSVVVGNIGSGTKMDLTMVGDTVNSSSRLEALTKEYNLGMLVSDETAEKLEDNHSVRRVDLTLLKGKSNPVQVFEVFDYEPERIRDLKHEVLPDFKTAFDIYLAGEFTEAQKAYMSLIEKIGPHTYRKNVCADPVLDVFADRCRILSVQCEQGLLDKEMWTGVYTF